jgi:hypothetical protein
MVPPGKAYALAWNAQQHIGAEILVFIVQDGEGIVPRRNLCEAQYRRRRSAYAGLVGSGIFVAMREEGRVPGKAGPDHPFG